MKRLNILFLSSIKMYTTKCFKYEQSINEGYPNFVYIWKMCPYLKLRAQLVSPKESMQNTMPFSVLCVISNVTRTSFKIRKCERK
jgi:hypothetical protein